MTGLLALEPGALFGRDFRVLRRLAEGGMGALYEVEQVSTGRRRALKVLLPQLVADPRQRERFAMEARVGAKIASEHVVEVTAAGVDEATQTPWLVMELLDGEDLATLLRRRSTVPRGELATIFDQLGDALGKAHAAGIVHRDLKPENVFVTRSSVRGVDVVVKVVDFGIATLIAENQSSASVTSAIGSPLYMAPEQATVGARVQPSTDVWPLGLIAFEALTGHTYWRSARVSDTEFNLSQLLVEVMVTPLEPASVRAGDRAALLPPGFDAWFSRCVVRDPAARFHDARACVEALLPVLRGAAGYASTRALDAPLVAVSLDEAYAPTAVSTPAFAAPAQPTYAPTRAAQSPYAPPQPPYAPQAPYAPPYAPPQPPYAQPPFPQAPMPPGYAPVVTPRNDRNALALWVGATVGIIALTCVLAIVVGVLQGYRERDRGTVTAAPSVAPSASPSAAPSVAPRPACDVEGVPDAPRELERDIEAAMQPHEVAITSCMARARDRVDPTRGSARLHWIVDHGRMRCATTEGLDEAPEIAACLTDALRGITFPDSIGRPYSWARALEIPFGERCDFHGLSAASPTFVHQSFPNAFQWRDQLRPCALAARGRGEAVPSMVRADWSVLPGRGVGCAQLRSRSMPPALAACVVDTIHQTRVRPGPRPVLVANQLLFFY